MSVEKILLGIANELTAEKVVYYKDRTNWSKQMVRRILENEHYTGDGEYPAIIDKEIYSKANKIRLGKGGDREKDSAEIHYLKYHTTCTQCGSRYTRKAAFNSRSEKWICINGCKTPRFIDDRTFTEELVEQINAVIAYPELLTYEHFEGKLYSPTIKVQRDERTLNNMMYQNTMNFQILKKAYFDLLTEEFDCCKLDKSREVTEALIEYFRQRSPVDGIDVELLKTVLAEILINENGEILLRFVNDAIIPSVRKEQQNEQ